MESNHPAGDLLTEITDQNLTVGVNAGQGWTTTITSLTCYGVSWVLGNKGNFCTATVECMSNCR